MRILFQTCLSIVAAAALLMASCKKQDEWLDVKRNKSDVVPKTLKDFQALLDNNGMYSNYISLGLLGSDNYFVNDANFQAVTQSQRNGYTWAADVFKGDDYPDDWINPYKKVVYANVVLEAMDKFGKNNETDQLRGAALFYRSFAFFELAQLFAKPYDKSTAASDPGVIMPLSSDPNARYGRSSVEDSYKRITEDLMTAGTLLNTESANQVRPSKAAVQALLARVFLSMRAYPEAFEWADKALQSKHTLLDLSDITSTPGQNPFPAFGHNPEVIFYASQDYNYGFIVPFGRGFIDSNLYNSYRTEDLRKTYFYFPRSGYYKFQAPYTGSYENFSGLATNELYLIRAEAGARTGKLQESLDDLNALLVKRWDKNFPFVPVSFTDAKDCVKFILEERRREMPFTAGLRWDDLRRTGLEPGYAQDLTRIIGGATYTLKAGDKRYVYPIPANELKYNPVSQNPR